MALVFNVILLCFSGVLPCSLAGSSWGLIFVCSVCFSLSYSLIVFSSICLISSSVKKQIIYKILGTWPVVTLGISHIHSWTRNWVGIHPDWVVVSMPLAKLSSWVTVTEIITVMLSISPWMEKVHSRRWFHIVSLALSLPNHL